MPRACLDQLFARAVLDQGGQIEVIVPAARYRAGLPPDTHADYDDLLSHASTVHRLHFLESTPETHMAASELVISMISELLAVWDHQPARAYGGTADVVAHARDQGRPVRIIWPHGADHLASRRIPRLSGRDWKFVGVGMMALHRCSTTRAVKVAQVVGIGSEVLCLCPGELHSPRADWLSEPHGSPGSSAECLGPDPVDLLRPGVAEFDAGAVES